VRFAVIADIHANLTALQSVLSAIDAREGVDRIVCVGDVVGRGPHPNEVLSLLRERQIETVLGNYDDAVAFDRLGSGVDFARAEDEDLDQVAVAWTRRTLTPENLAHLRGLPRDLRLFPIGSRVGVSRDELHKSAGVQGRQFFMRSLFGGLYRAPPSRVRRVLVLHGSPRALNERVTGDTANTILSAIANEAKADLLISAHAGESFHREAAGMAFIGVGGVSGPHAHPGEAEYAVVDVRGETRVEFGTASYNVQEHVRAIGAAGLPRELAADLR